MLMARAGIMVGGFLVGVKALDAHGNKPNNGCDEFKA